MTLDVYYRSDIQRGIQATVIMAIHVHLSSGARNTEHIDGILAHAHAQATLYGLDWPALVATCKGELGVDIGLLDTPRTIGEQT